MTSPSKTQVDEYNNGVKDINIASQAFNAANQSLNKERGNALEDWNKAVAAFFDEHTPHYK